VQPDPARLHRCGKCKVLNYCGQDCQAEHWKVVHKNHCKLLARAKESSETPVTIYSQHPFPSIPPPENTLEVLVELIQRVLVKMQDTNHPAFVMFPTEMEGLLATVVRNREIMWAHQKSDPKLTNIYPRGLRNSVKLVDLTLTKYLAYHRDPHDLGSILRLLWFRLQDHTIVLEVSGMKEPHAFIPEELCYGVQKEVRNFPTLLQNVIKAFDSSGHDHEFPSFKNLLKIYCGGNLEQACTFCSRTMKIEAITGEANGLCDYNVGLAVVQPYFSPTFSCGDPVCYMMMLDRVNGWNDWVQAAKALWGKWQHGTCDFCFKRAVKVYRCSRCLTKNWCGKECQLEDWKTSHKEFCREGYEKRKIKEKVKN